MIFFPSQFLRASGWKWYRFCIVCISNDLCTFVFVYIVVYPAKKGSIEFISIAIFCKLIFTRTLKNYKSLSKSINHWAGVNSLNTGSVLNIWNGLQSGQSVHKRAKGRKASHHSYIRCLVHFHYLVSLPYIVFDKKNILNTLMLIFKRWTPFT